MATPTVSLVLPTFNRADALRHTLPLTLAVRGVDEVVVVDDHSQDDSLEVVRAAQDPRVRTFRQPRRTGLPAVRNRGVRESTGEWVVFGEDDCSLPPDYVERMLATAQEHGADLVGAPWVWSPDAPVEETLAALRRDAVDEVALDRVGSFPTRPLATPFLPALVLVHRRVFDAGVWYDPEYRGNAYREETAFFVAATRAGFRCVLTPDTYSWQQQRWRGGAHIPKWRYELWTIRNTGRFLRRHGRWLHEQGLAGEPVRTQLAFTGARLRQLAEHYRWTLKWKVAVAIGLRDEAPSVYR